ncbi:alpha/beta-hydrolase [Heliocybe sulcata]|uniref:Carboxylic ester hydrolase n=1 Tax=Heliocybe sulcata TaxID=5364 RepID=A0A5C3MJN7_9AGAM|nr:alpha/beta-hydrolase [Heliocybe sulcata]
MLSWRDVILAALLPSWYCSIQDPVVDLGYVQYRGNQTNSNTIAYLGIPYAEPPLADLRFRAPRTLNTTRVTHEARGTILNITECPDFCVQGTTGSGDAGGAGTEDCLNMNIYTPSNARRGSRLPVFVYFHGGGYTYGNPALWPFDHWIEQSPDVIIVAPYYRLDSLGFLSHPAFIDSELGDLNVGFQDQLLALKWVQRHIRAFGGDPAKVSIGGHSAGASSVELHLVAKEPEHLFSAAIAQSVFRVPLALPEQTLPLFEYYASNAGCGTGRLSEQMKCLRGADIGALARAQDAAYYNFTGYNAFRPMVDGRIITDFPTRSLLRGEFARVPILLGSTSNESLPEVVDFIATLKSVWPSLTDFDLDGFASLYAPGQFATDEERIRASTGESLNRCARNIIGSALSVTNNTWAYRYNQPVRGSDAVEHGAENWMFFDGTNPGPNGSTTFSPQTPLELAFSSELIAYWLSFVRSGNPNTYKLGWSPQWARYSLANRMRIVLQEGPEETANRSGSYMEMEPMDEGLRCAFIVSKVDHQQN